MSDFIESKVVEVDVKRWFSFKFKRVDGRWTSYDLFECSCGKKDLIIEYNYCPNCGSKIKWINKNES